MVLLVVPVDNLSPERWKELARNVDEDAPINLQLAWKLSDGIYVDCRLPQ